MSESSKTLLKTLAPYLQKDSQYQLTRVGITEVKRTIIPAEIKVKAEYHIDKDSYILLSKLALDLGFTTDELLRRISWALTS